MRSASNSKETIETLFPNSEILEKRKDHIIFTQITSNTFNRY